MFVDYSAIDQSISLNNASNTDDDDDKKESSESNTSIWLLASSIILVVALVFAILAIFLKDAIKKARRNKVTSKNQYDQRKANRYKRKLHLKTEQTVEVDGESENADDSGVAEDATAEEVPEVTEELIEKILDETPEDTVETTEEVSQESTEEVTPEESPDNSDKQE